MAKKPRKTKRENDEPWSQHGRVKIPHLPLGSQATLLAGGDSRQVHHNKAKKNALKAPSGLTMQQGRCHNQNPHHRPQRQLANVGSQLEAASHVQLKKHQALRATKDRLGHSFLAVPWQASTFLVQFLPDLAKAHHDASGQAACLGAILNPLGNCSMEMPRKHFDQRGLRAWDT